MVGDRGGAGLWAGYCANRCPVKGVAGGAFEVTVEALSLSRCRAVETSGQGGHTLQLLRGTVGATAGYPLGPSPLGMRKPTRGSVKM